MNILKRKGQMSGGLIGTFAAVIGVAFILLILGIFQAYSADIVSDVQQDFHGTGCNDTTRENCGYAANVTWENLEANDNLSEKQSTLTNIAVAVIIISMLLIAAAIVGIRIATG